MSQLELDQPDAIAIVGMTCRFPGAKNVDDFWHNLQNGVESITFFSDQEMEEAGVDASLLQSPNYVKAKPVLEDAELFDAAFFKINPREAEVLDPQQRHFLECAWEALESAGYDPGTYKGRIGVYAGAEHETYLANNLATNPKRLAGVSGLLITLSTDRSYLSTRISYEFNLRGPSITVQTACSTSLVALHLACESLLNSECDMALVGGVTVVTPQTVGYLHEPGSISSPDGHCRAFDAQAHGTLFGNGIGVLVLKRLEDALADGDCIHAMVLGSAINNDGSLKVGYTAPSVDGQAAVIAEAQAVAGVEPETITYVETHGAGTELGDPIEVAALTKAFRLRTNKAGFCAIGSAKSNFGHLGAAAGMAGLIKTILALKHKQIPPSLNFEQPSPNIDFANSPFYVNAKLQEWASNGAPRRAGVSSFGMGGTNAHVILEEPPQVEAPAPGKPWQVLVLSAKSGTALEQASDRLLEHLKRQPDLNLADVAYTLQLGRRAFSFRRALVCRDVSDAIAALEARDPKHIWSAFHEDAGRPVAFMFPGLGDQYPNMALGLYQTEPIFCAQLDRCAEGLRPHLGLDIRTVIFPEGSQAKPEDKKPASSSGAGFDLRKMLGRTQEPQDEATQRLNQTKLAHPAVFCIEYALASLLMDWGIRPQAVIGHSIGEYVAACVAGVLSLDEALSLVAQRARMIQALPGGAMLAVPLSEEEVQPYLSEALSLSAINGPRLCVLAGSNEAVAALESSLIEQGTACRRVQTSHAFHSHMLEPILEDLNRLVQTFKLKAPTIPYVSNLSGDWITPEQATDPGYWAKHSRHAVRFADGIRLLLQDPQRILLEVGPGHTLTSMAIQQTTDPAAAQSIFSSMRHAYEPQPDSAVALSAVGQAWANGAAVEWPAFYRQQPRQRVTLPTYPFERQRYWVEPGSGQAAAPDPLAKQADKADWFYIPSWKRSAPPVEKPGSVARRWLIFGDGKGLSEALTRCLQARGNEVISVLEGKHFAAKGKSYTLRPAVSDDYKALLADLAGRNLKLDGVVHIWNLAPLAKSAPELSQAALQRSFYSPLFLVQALGQRERAGRLPVVLVSSGVQQVASEEVIYPEKAALLGVSRTVGPDTTGLICRNVDIALTKPGSTQEAYLARQLATEIELETHETVAYRGRDRWVQTYEAVRLPEVRAGGHPMLRPGGAYLVADGSGGVGLAIARYLARAVQAKLLLITPYRLPEVEARAAYLADHPPHDPISQLIQTAQELEKLNTQVLLMRADTSNPTQMKAAIQAANQQLGMLYGVIYAAGVTREGMTSPAGSEALAAAPGFHVQSIRVIEALVHAIPLDFMLVCSSLADLLGESGQAADCAAGAFMDAFAHAGNDDERRWMSVNWDSPAMAEHQLTAELFQRILAHNRTAQVAVCANHLPARMARAYAPAGPDQPEVAPAAYARPDLPTAYTAPSSGVEEKLAGMWQQLLGITKVGRNDSFFRLGGHSLVAMQLINRVRDTFEVDIPLRASFEAPTIAELAECIEAARQAAHSAATAPMTPVARGNGLPVSLVQQQLWSLSQARPGSAPASSPQLPKGGLLNKLLDVVRPGAAPASGGPITHQADRLYRAGNLLSTVRLSGDLNLAVLEQSLTELVRRHESLRSAFRPVDGQVTLVVAPAAVIKLPVTNWSGLAETEQQARLQQELNQEAQHAFDLSQSPVWKPNLLALAADQHLLVLNMHRAICDERSIEIFVQELAALYEAFATDQPSPLPALPLQYADFAAWQRTWLQKEMIEEQLTYWTQQLGQGLSGLNLAGERSGPVSPALLQASQAFMLSPELTTALKALGQHEDSTLFVTLLAAFKALLQRCSGQTDIVVGAPVMNRNRSEVEGMIGPFSNTLPLRTDLSSNPGFYELLRRLRQATLGAYAHQDTPLEILVEKLQASQVIVSPLYQAMFVLQNEPLESLNAAGLTLAEMDVDINRSGFDLKLFIKDTPQGLKGRLDYDPARFEAGVVAGWAERFQALLESVAAEPDRPLSELSF